jgi:heat shock protein HtpX
MATPATAHMFTVHSVRGSFLGSLFSTHPPIEERVKKLRRLAGLSAT